MNLQFVRDYEIVRVAMTLLIVGKGLTADGKTWILLSGSSLASKGSFDHHHLLAISTLVVFKFGPNDAVSHMASSGDLNFSDVSYRTSPPD